MQKVCETENRLEEATGAQVSVAKEVRDPTAPRELQVRARGVTAAAGTAWSALW